MKILVIHQYYLFPGAPGGSRFNEFARLWADAGHEVTIIAGTLNYATGEAPEQYRRKWSVKEKDGAVTVFRCYVPLSYARSYVGRMWAFFGFTLSAMTAALRAGRADVVIATSPPLVTAIPGWVAAKLRFRRSAFIFEVRDLWPESAVTTGVLKPKGFLTRLLYGLERWACRMADRIVVLTPAFRDDIARRGLAAETKIDFVPNGADAAFFPGPAESGVREKLGWRNRFVILYAGAHGRANALHQLIDAAERLRNRNDILIACVGDGPERQRLVDSAVQRGLNNIVFHGARPKDEMPSIVRAADAGAAVLARNQTFKTVYPNKVFDYMACEKATLLAIDGVARELVCGEAHAGVFAEPEDAADLAAQIERLAADRDAAARMGRAGREWVAANATREALARRYLTIASAAVK